MKYAVISADTHPMYAFFAPLTALVWRHVVGYEPIVVLVGARDEWGRLSAVRQAMIDRGITYTRIDVPDGYRSSTVAQVARLYGWMLGHGDDHVIVSDVDMWPLSRRWFQQGEAGTHQVSVLYANNRTRFPICYVAAHARTWCEMIYGRPAEEEIQRALFLEERVHEHMRLYQSPTTAAADAWQHDEEWLTARIHGWAGYPHRVRFIDRAAGDPPHDRLDRSAWLRFVGEHVDAHLLRPGPQNWPALRDLLSRIAPSELDWADSYVQAFSRS